MARTFKGQVHVRISPKVHEEIAKEAFEKGTSISGIIAQALTVRNVLRNIDPWKSINEIQEANLGVDQGKLELDIRKALKAVRKENRV
ncbi:MAG: toxin-antitoxin system HicB family antitoxin [Nitrospiria bacterium]